MGAFNTLVALLECTRCNNIYTAALQFKFGDTWQHEYHVGDVISWGGNDTGEPNLTSVKVYGIAENTVCPICAFENPEEFDIFLEADMIMSFVKMSDYQVYALNDDGNYFIIKR